jgi:hypothetical protein
VNDNEPDDLDAQASQEALQQQAMDAANAGDIEAATNAGVAANRIGEENMSGDDAQNLNTAVNQGEESSTWQPADSGDAGE